MNKIKLIRIILTSIFLAIILWGIILHVNPDKNTNWNFLFNSGASVVFIVGGVINFWYPNKINMMGNPRNVLCFLGLALIIYGIGLNIWTYYNLSYGKSMPYPSIPDAFFVFFYPLIFLATFFFLKLFSFLINEKIMRQMIVLSVILSIIVLSIFIRPEISESLSFWANILNVYYPLMSAVIFTLALTILRVSGGESTKSAIWLSSGLAIHGISTFFFSLRTAAGTYWNGDFTDILLVSSAYIISIAGINIITSLVPIKNDLDNL